MTKIEFKVDWFTPPQALHRRRLLAACNRTVQELHGGPCEAGPYALDILLNDAPVTQRGALYPEYDPDEHAALIHKWLQEMQVLAA